MKIWKHWKRYPEPSETCKQHQRMLYKLPCVVAINAFPTDTKAELDFVEAKM